MDHSERAHGTDRLSPAKTNEFMGQLLRGGVGSLLARVSEVLLGLAVIVLLARLLGPAGYGVYAFVFSLVSLVSVVARLGLPPLVVRETARGQRCEAWAEIEGIWRFSNRLVWTVSLAIAALGGLGVWLGWVQGPALRETLPWGLALIPVIALAGIRSASLAGLRHVLAGVFPEQVLRPAVLAVALLVVLYWYEKDFSPPQAMALTLAAGVVALIVGALLLRRYRPPEMVSVQPVYRMRPWLSAALPLLLTQSFEQVNRYTDVLMLGVLAAADDVGVYRVAAQGALLVSLAIFALSMAVAPFAARLYAEGDRAGLEAMARRTAQASLAFAVPAVIGFAFLGKWLLASLFGVGFEEAYWPLLVLSVGQVFNSLFGPTALFLNMTGHERDVTRAVAVSAGLNLALNLVMIPALGVLGAALATSISLVFWNVWLWFAVQSRLGIRCSAM